MIFTFPALYSVKQNLESLRNVIPLLAQHHRLPRVNQIGRSLFLLRVLPNSVHAQAQLKSGYLFVIMVFLFWVVLCRHLRFELALARACCA